MRGSERLTVSVAERERERASRADNAVFESCTRARAVDLLTNAVGVPVPAGMFTSLVADPGIVLVMSGASNLIVPSYDRR